MAANRGCQLMKIRINTVIKTDLKLKQVNKKRQGMNALGQGMSALGQGMNTLGQGMKALLGQCSSCTITMLHDQ